MTFTNELPLVLVLTQQEREFLDKHGSWLERLESGAITPTTAEQRQFVQVVWGEREPNIPHEHLWLRVRAHKESAERLESDRSHAVSKLATELAAPSLERLRAEVASLKVQITNYDGWLKESHNTISKLEHELGIAPEGTERNPLDAYATSGGNDWREQK